MSKKFCKYLLGLIISIIFLPLALAVDFNVNCPATVIPGQSFDCQVSMALVPSGGLSSLSFTADASGAGISVTFSQGTDVSSQGTYGFFVVNPLTTTASFATIHVMPTVSQTFVTLQLTGVAGRLGDAARTRLSPTNPSPNNIVFQSPSISIQAAPPSCTASAWSCGAWSTCASGTQTRTCTLTDTSCTNPNLVRPLSTQSCTVPCIDNDGDSYGVGCAAGLDCDDNSLNINPEALEQCDGVDNDCDGTLDAATCSCTNGQTQICGSNVGICRQGTQTCSNGQWGICTGEVKATAEVCDSLDNDCDGQLDENLIQTYYLDADGDGFGLVTSSMNACALPISGYVAGSGDCDDTNSVVNPSAAEVCGNTIDENCDGTAQLCPSSCSEGDLISSGCTCDRPGLQSLGGLCQCPNEIGTGKVQHLVRGQCTPLLTNIKNSLEDDNTYAGVMQKSSRIAQLLRKFLCDVGILRTGCPSP